MSGLSHLLAVSLVPPLFAYMQAELRCPRLRANTQRLQGFPCCTGLVELVVRPGHVLLRRGLIDSSSLYMFLRRVQPVRCPVFCLVVWKLAQRLEQRVAGHADHARRFRFARGRPVMNLLGDAHRASLLGASRTH